MEEAMEAKKQAKALPSPQPVVKVGVTVPQRKVTTTSVPC
jgi:hypothetical protein